MLACQFQGNFKVSEVNQTHLPDRGLCVYLVCVLPGLWRKQHTVSMSDYQDLLLTANTNTRVNGPSTASRL